jgi:DNA-binding XRE family transcriptional regulator
MKQAKLVKSLVWESNSRAIYSNAEEDLNQKLGRVIRGLRKDLKQNQLTMAKSLGRSRTSLVNIEQGKQGIDVETLEKLGKIFNIPSYDLLKRAY